MEEFKKNIEQKLLQRDYYGMFQLIDSASESYLTTNTKNYAFCIELISQNQDLLEYMGASKQFEMEFDLQNKLIRNRNRLFLSCLDNEQNELKNIFKRCVGDNSREY